MKNALKELQKNPALAALALARTKGLGRVTAARLMEALGGPAEVYRLGPDELADRTGLGLELARRIHEPDRAGEAAEEFQKAAQHRIAVVPFGAADYPEEFGNLQDPPIALYRRGTWNQKERRLAVVGTRRPSRAGVVSARLFAGELAASGAAIVSGLALGIDTLAHEAALEARGRTYAVLGSGLLSVYPRENRRLAERIAESGALFSEFALLEGPESFHFPLRNRLISVLGCGVVLVEAPRKSGAGRKSAAVVAEPAGGPP